MMKQIFLAASLFALSACGPDGQTTNEPKPGDIVEEAADDTANVAENIGEEISAAIGNAAEETAEFAENELSQMNARGFAVRNILGANIRDSVGSSLGTVDDLLFDTNYTLRAVVVTDGAILGIGGDNAIIAADRFQFSTAGDGDMTIVAEFTDGELKQMTSSLSYEPTSGIIDPGDLLSVEAFLEQPITNSNGDEVADAFDILLIEPATWHTIILSVGGLGGIGNRLVAVDTSLINIDSASSTVVLDSRAADLDSMTTFDY